MKTEMAPHSSILAWEIPWTEEPGSLQSMGLQSRTRLSDFTFTFTKMEVARSQGLPATPAARKEA